MREDLFDACWQRVERAREHRQAAAGIWNAFLEDEPFEPSLLHEGEGRHVLSVEQTVPTPPGLSVRLGEWLYNLRCALDYVIYAAAAHASGTVPPPHAEKLQFPVCHTEKAWDRERKRLAGLPEHQQHLLFLLQPFRHDPPDTSPLQWLNHLARMDRHRRLTVLTAYLATSEPTVQVPRGMQIEFHDGERILRDYLVDAARFTVTPWHDDTQLEARPGVGIDPEVAEWAESPFWRAIPYNERLVIVEVFVEAIIATFEYDCTGHSRKRHLLTDSFHAESDARRRHGNHLVG